jgi:hypothetical protein
MRMTKHVYFKAAYAVTAVIMVSCSPNDDESYVYLCWSCRSEKHVCRDSKKETIVPSLMSEWYLTRQPLHQHHWWYAYRKSDRGLINATNGCPMCVITADEQEVFARSASLDELRDFENDVISSSEDQQKKAVEMVRSARRK